MLEINISEIVIFIFFAAAAVQTILYLFVYPALLVPPKKIENTVEMPVSVIICARNEEKNLRKHLPLILAQDYPQFEVIVVDDCSDDGTEFLLKQMEAKHPNLRSTRLNPDNKFRHGKKLALTVGIKSAKYETLMLTDADCRPDSEGWLRSFVRKFSGGKTIVLGYGGYIHKDGLLDKLVRFDTIFVAINYLSAARWGMPYMGVGRNLAYSKELFFKNKGFATHYGFISGDDDLFVNEVATKANTTLNLDEGSITRSVQVRSFIHWVYQKKRHLSSSQKYRSATKLYLGIEPLSRLLYFMSGTAALAIFYKSDMLQLILIAIGVRQLVQLVVFKLSMRRLGERNLLLYSPIFDALQPIIYLIFFSNNLFAGGPKKWK